MITGKILKLRGWPEGKIIGLAKAAAQRLEMEGLEQDAILARLDAVRLNAGAHLADLQFGDLARETWRRINR